jgi:hypothetical protein
MRAVFVKNGRTELRDHLVEVFKKIKPNIIDDQTKLDILKYIDSVTVFEVETNSKSSTGVEMVLPEELSVPGFVPIDPNYFVLHRSSIMDKYKTKLICELTSTTESKTNSRHS